MTAGFCPRLKSGVLVFQAKTILHPPWRDERWSRLGYSFDYGLPTLFQASPAPTITTVVVTDSWHVPYHATTIGHYNSSKPIPLSPEATGLGVMEDCLRKEEPGDYLSGLDWSEGDVRTNV